MAAPTTITVTYVNSPPSGTTTQTLPIPSAGGAMTDPSMAVLNLIRSGGFWFSDPAGVLTFVPVGQVTKITAQ